MFVEICLLAESYMCTILSFVIKHNTHTQKQKPSDCIESCFKNETNVSKFEIEKNLKVLFLIQQKKNESKAEHETSTTQRNQLLIPKLIHNTSSLSHNSLKSSNFKAPFSLQTLKYLCRRKKTDKRIKSNSRKYNENKTTKFTNKKKA